MASERRDLRIQARRLNIPNARELGLDELKDAIAEAENSNGAISSGKKARKAVAVKVKVKKRGRPRKVVEDEVLDEEETVAPAKKRGRPKGSEKKKVTAAKKTTTGKRRGRPPKAATAEPVKRGRGRPPKSATVKPAKASGNKLGRPPGSGTGTRVAVPDKINWDKNFEFRAGSIAGVILEELKKQGGKKKNTTTADVRESTIESLEGDLGSEPFIFKHRGGSKYTKPEGLAMLRYRVNRTIFDYARETGQHGSKNGASTKAASTKKRGRPAKSPAAASSSKRGRGRPRKTEAEATPKRRGRPPKAKTSTKASRGPGRPKGSGTGKKRGRPKGSKSKG